MIDNRPEVKITDTDGNVFTIIGRSKEAAREANWSNNKITIVIDEMLKASDYRTVIRIMKKYFEVI